MGRGYLAAGCQSVLIVKEEGCEPVIGGVGVAAREWKGVGRG